MGATFSTIRIFLRPVSIASRVHSSSFRTRGRTAIWISASATAPRRRSRSHAEPGMSRSRNMWIKGLVATACAGALLVAVPTAHALDAEVESFDGTLIDTHFFPAAGLAEGQQAPTILIGHGWGGT